MNNDENNQPRLRQVPDFGQSVTDIDQVVRQEQPTAAETLRTPAQLDDAPVDRHTGRWDLGAIYARAILETQNSLEAQTEACLRYVEATRISVPDKWRFAETAGGFHMRPEYQKVMELARSGQVRHIIVFLPDRLGRGTAFISDMRDLERLGVRMHTHLGEIPWEMVPFGLMNEHYFHNLSKRSRTGRR